MMHGLLFGLLLIVACALTAALMRQPGVVLYDWIATRANRRRAAVQQRRAVKHAAVREAAKAKRSQPATLAG
ncbi:hypothetical protein [Achromobacter sp.]|uniref:hypothetical protein n=1 Tax=Achromobacter sp. TaxID=134375 RepID=UPI002F954C0E